MKQLFILLGTVLLCNWCLAQAPDTIWYDGQWNQLKDTTGMVWYRIATTDKIGRPKGIVRTYYRTGELYSESKLLLIFPETLDGKAVWYHKNGLRRQTTTLRKGAVVGYLCRWDEAGTPLEMQYYRKGVNIAKTISGLQLYDFEPDSTLQTIAWFKKHLHLKLKPNHETALLFDDWGNYHYDLKDYRHAIAFYKVAANLNQKLNLPLSQANSLICIGLTYSADSRPGLGIAYLNQAADLQKPVLGDSHPAYLQTLGYIEALNARISNYPLSWANLNRQAKSFAQKGDYPNALIYAERACKAAENEFGINHEHYATALNELAGLHKLMGSYADAEKLYLQSRTIMAATLGTTHPDYAVLLNNLAALYFSTGNYADAEALWLQCKEIVAQNQGTASTAYATVLNNLAALYESLGNYAVAEPLYAESVNLFAGAYGKNDPNYAQALGNLAGLYEAMGNYEDALPMYTESKNIRAATFGTMHPIYATSLNNLAHLYFKMHNYAQAETMYQETIDIQKNTLGIQHPDYATTLNNLALVYAASGNYAGAEALWSECETILAQTLGISHPAYAKNLNNLGHLHEAMGNYPAAEPLYIEANNILNRQITANFSFLTEKEKERYVKTIERNFETYLSFVLRRMTDNPDITTMAYDNELAHKGMILQSATALRNATAQSNDPQLQAILLKLTQTRNMLGKLYEKPSNERFLSTDSLENLANDLEKQLLNQSKLIPGMEELLTNTSHSWREVQANLKPGEAAIEFVAFRYRAPRRWTDSTFYCALVLTRAMKQPEMIFLFEEQYLSALFEYARTAPHEMVEDLYAPPSNPLDTNALYTLIWQPIERILADAHTVYLSPAGLLHRVAFHAIPAPGGKLISEGCRLVNLSTTARLCNRKSFAATDIQNMFVCGGIDYDFSDASKTAPPPKGGISMSSQSTIRSFYQDSTCRGGMWNYLPGTWQEYKAITSLFAQKNKPFTGLDATAATEERIKQLNGPQAPSILHLATHGFFFPDDSATKQQMNFLHEQVQYVHDQNPLLRSGLLLAGGNLAWTGKAVPGIEDGVLSAWEVSQLWLPKTRLVVLSACQTGLGDVQGDEGVIGLQRGFKMAGVDFLIISLWEVNDDATRLFMTTFYEALLAGNELRQAFSLAREGIKTQYAQNPANKNILPFFWAPFVLIE